MSEAERANRASQNKGMLRCGAAERKPLDAINTEDLVTRQTCLTCRRPTTHCWCGKITPLSTRTRVLFLQHPRERDVPIGTARMAHLALTGSRLVDGVKLDDHPLVVDALSQHSAVLFPGGKPLEEWLPNPPKTLIVLDGTWWQADKLLKLNPTLAAAPRLSYRPSEPGNYRIRKEPSAECLATIEAVAAVLGELEGEPEKFRSMLAPFAYMVDQQLAAVAGQRRRRDRKKRPAHLAELEPVRAHPERGVVLYAEANLQPRSSRVPGAPEALHVVAAGLDGRRFEAILKPRQPLHDDTCRRLGVSRHDFEDGEPVEKALERLRSFVGNSPIWMCWGPFARDLLSREGESRHGFVDVRALACRHLRGSPGGIEKAANALEVPLSSATSRAQRQLAHILGITERLMAHRSMTT
jgi:DTW domain-containing protein